jgi:hypothetical protein
MHAFTNSNYINNIIAKLSIHDIRYYFTRNCPYSRKGECMLPLDTMYVLQYTCMHRPLVEHVMYSFN